jgi:hypothetical protein
MTRKEPVEPTPTPKFRVGQRVRVRYPDGWYPSRIVELREDDVVVIGDNDVRYECAYEDLRPDLG